MIALARRKDTRRVSTLVGSKPIGATPLDEPVDVAFCMFDGLDALLNNEDIVRHFRAIAYQSHGQWVVPVDLTHRVNVPF